MTDNRSISIGGNVSGSILQTGDQNVATLTATTLPPAETVDIAAVLTELRALMTAGAAPASPRIQLELDDAAAEATKPAPERPEIAGALERALGSFKKTADFATNATKVAELVTKAAGWIGAAHVGGLLGLVGLTL